jgi:hypothetical protein
MRVCHEHKRELVVLYQRWEIRPPEVGLQEQASNRPVLLRSKRRGGERLWKSHSIRMAGMDWEDERKQTVR